MSAADFQSWIDGLDISFPQCPSESAEQHQLKRALLSMASVGGSVVFPSSLSGSLQLKILEFCREEPALQMVTAKQYGQGSQRFVRASVADTARGILEAKAFLEAESAACPGVANADMEEAHKRASAAEQKCYYLQRRLDDLQQQLDTAQGKRGLEELSLDSLVELQGQLVSRLQAVAEEIKRRSIAHSRHAGDWQWQTHDGTFETFEASAMVHIKDHIAKHNGMITGSVQVSNRGKAILIDLDAMEQRVIDGSGKRRAIRSADEMLLREPSWTHQAGPANLVDVPPGTSDHIQVLNLMFSNDALGESFRPVRIQRIQNKFLMRRFDTERQNMIVQRGVESLNERKLFHGTGRTDPRAIAEQKEGFMLDYANSGYYGKGLYYAVRPQYSHHYSHFTSSNEGNMRHYHMLLCRVLCGRSRQMGTSIDRAMTRTALPIETYDSIMAGPHSSPSGSSTMYVIYQEAQVYPDFIVTYRTKLPMDEPVLVPREAA